MNLARVLAVGLLILACAAGVLYIVDLGQDQAAPASPELQEESVSSSSQAFAHEAVTRAAAQTETTVGSGPPIAPNTRTFFFHLDGPSGPPAAEARVSFLSLADSQTNSLHADLGGVLQVALPRGQHLLQASYSDYQGRAWFLSRIIASDQGSEEEHLVMLPSNDLVEVIVLDRNGPVAGEPVFLATAEALQASVTNAQGSASFGRPDAESVTVLVGDRLAPTAVQDALLKLGESRTIVVVLTGPSLRIQVRDPAKLGELLCVSLDAIDDPSMRHTRYWYLVPDTDITARNIRSGRYFVSIALKDPAGRVSQPSAYAQKVFLLELFDRDLTIDHALELRAQVNLSVEDSDGKSVSRARVRVEQATGEISYYDPIAPCNWSSRRLSPIPVPVGEILLRVDSASHGYGETYLTVLPGTTMNALVRLQHTANNLDLWIGNDDLPKIESVWFIKPDGVVIRRWIPPSGRLDFTFSEQAAPERREEGRVYEVGQFEGGELKMAVLLRDGGQFLIRRSEWNGQPIDLEIP